MNIEHNAALFVQNTMPHTNPAYWGGHALGDGNAVEVPPTITTPKGLANQVCERLEGGIPSLIGSVECEAFKSGEVFDANDHPAGTIVLSRFEVLSGIAACISRLPKYTPDNIALPMPTDLIHQWDWLAQPIELGNESLRYRSWLIWAVVVEGLKRGGSAQLVTVNAVNIVDHSPATLRVKAELPGQPRAAIFGPKITVGEVKHVANRYPVGRPGREALMRVTALEKCKPAQPKDASYTWI